MLSSAYFLAKFRFDTAENEPAKNLQNFKFANFSQSSWSQALEKAQEARLQHLSAASAEERAAAALSDGRLVSDRRIVLEAVLRSEVNNFE